MRANGWTSIREGLLFEGGFYSRVYGIFASKKKLAFCQIPIFASKKKWNFVKYLYLLVKNAGILSNTYIC